ncbi:MAG: hypothetical protein HY875_13220 [Chloroflexi bacterium]|nr:hypothetical protein [Chloroflexota bacterium]
MRAIAVALFLLVALAASVGCRGGNDDNVPTNTPAAAASRTAPRTAGASPGAIASASPSGRPGEFVRRLKHGGRDRGYILHVPAIYSAARPMPLVFALHGGGGEAKGIAPLSGLSRLGDREGFIVVYPEGVEGSWNDGREDPDVPAQRLKVDDVGFITAIIDDVSGDYAVDPRRVYAMGISNGGFMSHRLGCELSGRIAAIGPIVATLPEALDCRPGRAVPVVMFVGDADPLVPYEGGHVQLGLGRERSSVILSAQATAHFWATNNGCNRAAVAFSSLPDNDKSDGVRIRREAYSGCRAGADVLLYVMEGGGHVWPGGPQYSPQIVIGRATHDIDASEIAWAFFKEHPLP